MNDTIEVLKVKGGYDAKWDSVHGTGKTHMEALKGLHYMLNFFDGTIENPQPLPVKIYKFEDACEDTKCPCIKTNHGEDCCGDHTAHNHLGCCSEGKEEEVCEDCGGKNGEHQDVPQMEAVYPGEPHMADVGSRPCPQLTDNQNDDHDADN